MSQLYIDLQATELGSVIEHLEMLNLNLLSHSGTYIILKQVSFIASARLSLYKNLRLMKHYSKK